MAISPDYAKLAKVPLVKQCRMATEMKQEAIDICTSCLDKQPNDFERCSQMVKENMEKKFGGLWNVVSGKSFAYEVTHGVQDMLLLYLGSASVGMLIWRV